jgi:hypothetical protein
MPGPLELDARDRRLPAALGVLQLPATEPELRLLHLRLDTWYLSTPRSEEIA